MSDDHLLAFAADLDDPEDVLRASIVTHVTSGIRGLLDALGGDMNPVRALRLIETLASTSREQLAELGTAAGPSSSRRVGGGLGAGLGVGFGGHAPETVVLDTAMGFIQDTSEQMRGEFRSRQIRNLTTSLRNAKDLENADLTARLQAELDGLLAGDVDVGVEPLLEAMQDDEPDEPDLERIRHIAQHGLMVTDAEMEAAGAEDVAFGFVDSEGKPQEAVLVRDMTHRGTEQGEA